jgi:hypothetical protein
MYWKVDMGTLKKKTTKASSAQYKFALFNAEMLSFKSSSCGMITLSVKKISKTIKI